MQNYRCTFICEFVDDTTGELHEKEVVNLEWGSKKTFIESFCEAFLNWCIMHHVSDFTMIKMTDVEEFKKIIIPGIIGGVYYG